jgi:hypothetical protein
MEFNYRDILEQIQQDPIYQKNIRLGEPRRGHPEGTIQAHIEELEENLDRLRVKLSEHEADILRLMVHVHDTLKPDAKDGVAITDPRSHASLAREFLARYCDDTEVLRMIQYHDEPYALYLQHRKRGACDVERWERLLSRIQDWDLFAAFLIIDNCTRGKELKPLEWVFERLQPRLRLRWDTQDFIRFEK